MKVELVNDKGDVSKHSVTDAERILQLGIRMKAHGRKKVFYVLKEDSDWKYLNGVLVQKAKKSKKE